MGIFSDRISKEILLFDGSMGALIGQMGFKTACPDEMAITNSDVIESIHKAYIDSGANVILSDTFGATEMALSHKGKSGMGNEITKNAVKIARKAAGENALVAVDMGPTSEFMYPVGSYKMKDFYKTFYDQALSAKEAGCDFAMIETQTDVSECRAACLAAKDAGLEAACSFTFSSGRTLTGSTPECCALILEAAGASAIGVNCSTGPDQMLPIIKAIRNVTNLPIIVQPNAGLPETRPDGSVYYPFTPEEMLESMKKIVEAGASAIGGCCGTTPDHIRMLSSLSGAPAPEKPKIDTEYVCSKRVYVPLQYAVNDIEEIDDPEDLYDLDEETTLALIDLTGLTGEEAEEKTQECAAISKNPLAFKANSREALASALKNYPGVAAVIAEDDMQDVIDMYGAKRIEI